jgi:magnesium-transporting ATPase (P-type)
MNSDLPKFKTSNIDKTTNQMILYIFMIQLILCCFAAVGNGVWYYSNIDDHFYINKIYNSGVEGLLTFFTYIVLNNTMIPISLIVSLEVVKMCQGIMIELDDDMYDKK